MMYAPGEEPMFTGRAQVEESFRFIDCLSRPMMQPGIIWSRRFGWEHPFFGYE
jgi:hypothetical protein